MVVSAQAARLAAAVREGQFAPYQHKTGELDRTYTEDITGLEALDVEQAVTTRIGRAENRDAASRALSASNAAKTLQ